MYPGCVFIKSASCDHALISVSASAGSMVNMLISTIGPPLIFICSASVTFESSSLNLGMPISPLVVTCLLFGFRLSSASSEFPRAHARHICSSVSSLQVSNAYIHGFLLRLSCVIGRRTINGSRKLSSFRRRLPPSLGKTTAAQNPEDHALAYG